MERADAYGIGYLGWSWSGNGGGVEYLDMVHSFDANNRSAWGDRFIDGPNGLQQSSYAVEATVFGGTQPIPTPPPATPTPVPPTPTPSPGSAACRVDYVVRNAWPGGATVDVTITNRGNNAIKGWILQWIFPGSQQIAHLWNGSYVQMGTAVQVTNATWNGTIAPGGSVTFGFNLNWSGSNPIPTVFTLNGQLCS